MISVDEFIKRNDRRGCFFVNENPVEDFEDFAKEEAEYRRELNRGISHHYIYAGQPDRRRRGKK